MTAAQRQALDQIWSIFPEARLVGGVVRDLLMQRPVADVDLATPEPPERVLDLLVQAGVKAVPTGLSHGTITAVIASAPYEITTLRRDTETDGRHAVVCWTTDWREDAARRDFTINAMSRDKDGGLHDYFGGQSDLAQGLVRFVGDATTRIEEDALRILRFFRFQGRYGTGMPDSQAMQAITRHGDLLTLLSVERVWSELQRILTGPNAISQIVLMDQCGVLSRLLPEGADVQRFTSLVQAGAPANAPLRLAALAGGNKITLARRLKLSKAEEAFLVAVSSGSVPSVEATDDDALRRLLAQEPAESLIGRVWLEQADSVANRTGKNINAADTPEGDDATGYEVLRARLAAMPRPVFPLAGRDVLAAGHPPGPDVGKVLQKVQDWWMQNGCTASRDACLAQLSTVLSENLE
ncbi:poly(A) polymerase [Acetobacter indonesiensis]|nr:poly(A) polymerase [Acetobacter indonesiensis]